MHLLMFQSSKKKLNLFLTIGLIPTANLIKGCIIFCIYKQEELYFFKMLFFEAKALLIKQMAALDDGSNRTMWSCPVTEANLYLLTYSQ